MREAILGMHPISATLTWLRNMALRLCQRLQIPVPANVDLTQLLMTEALDDTGS